MYSFFCRHGVVKSHGLRFVCFSPLVLSNHVAFFVLVARIVALFQLKLYFDFGFENFQPIWCHIDVFKLYGVLWRRFYKTFSTCHSRFMLSKVPIDVDMFFCVNTSGAWPILLSSSLWYLSCVALILFSTFWCKVPEWCKRWAFRGWGDFFTFSSGCSALRASIVVGPGGCMARFRLKGVKCLCRWSWMLQTHDRVLHINFSVTLVLYDVMPLSFDDHRTAYFGLSTRFQLICWLLQGKCSRYFPLHFKEITN